ncbi:MAG: hypothetical protein GQ524_07615 [Anaerolineales bacterium]|nr:hypothetical protein [Anaerolineales bacterium]
MPEIEHEAFIDASRHQLIVNGANVKAAGFTGILARCTIGWSYVDPFYEQNYRIALENDLWFGAYHVTWPINRAPEREAQWFVDHLIPQGQSQEPKYTAIDSELGTKYHESGHHLVSGNEIIQMTIEECNQVQLKTNKLPWIYTARWFWNSNKLKPFIGQGETAYPLHIANYPWSTPPRDVGIDPTLKYNVYPLIADPWSEEQLIAWQWTSKWPHQQQLAQSHGLDANIFWNKYTEPGEPPVVQPPVPIKITYPTGKAIVTIEEV